MCVWKTFKKMSDQDVVQSVYRGVLHTEQTVDVLANMIDDILRHCDHTDKKLRKLKRKVRKLRR